jgi:hypothetical protein
MTATATLDMDTRESLELRKLRAEVKVAELDVQQRSRAWVGRLGALTGAVTMVGLIVALVRDVLAVRDQLEEARQTVVEEKTRADDATVRAGTADVILRVQSERASAAESAVAAIDPRARRPVVAAEQLDEARDLYRRELRTVDDVQRRAASTRSAPDQQQLAEATNRLSKIGARLPADEVLRIHKEHLDRDFRK